ncbi:MFS general substrate transporter [Heliocybe sulcata]|uniref:MFS general substrate transporter n=1 Tax=Heliocybe sulcata TaxID=5364 RepID=A0A5C3NGT8_9AGAM|nr:MFS general substrate transporter [Heliocybe sulcata]
MNEPRPSPPSPTRDTTSDLFTKDDRASNSMALSQSSSLSGWRAYTMIAATSGSTLLNVFSGGALTVAVPSIGRDLRFTQSDLSWPLQAFNLTYGCLLLLTGRLADKYGRRTVFLLGTALFALLSVPPIFCPDSVSFTVVMAVLGIAASLMTSSAMGLIGGNLEGALKNRAIAVLAGGQSIGFILGLLASGFLCDLHRGWRWIYVIQSALGTLFFLIGLASIPKDRVKYEREMDWVGVALSTTGLVLLIFSLSQSQNVGWATAYIPALFAISVVVLGCFVAWEHTRERAGHAVLLAPSVFIKVRFSAMILLTFFVWWAFNAQEYFITLYYQDVQLLSPSQTGLRFIPEAISGVVLNTLIGWLVEYVPGQWLNAVGACAIIASAAVFATMEPSTSYWLSAFWIMILVSGADAIYTVGNLYTLTSMDERSQGLAGGLFGTTTRLATSVGLAVSSVLSTAVSVGRSPDAASRPAPGELLRGYHAVGWLALGMAAVGLALNIIFLRRLGVLGGKRGARLRKGEVEKDRKVDTAGQIAAS